MGDYDISRFTLDELLNDYAEKTKAASVAHDKVEQRLRELTESGDKNIAWTLLQWARGVVNV